MGAVPELDLARINRYCADKIPAQHLDKLRIEATVRGKSVTISECRAPWQPEMSDEWTRHGVAQLRYDPVDCNWSLFCADRNARWHLFEPHAYGSAEELIAEIEEDKTGIFWG
jgi:hypothetical protein